MPTKEEIKQEQIRREIARRAAAKSQGPQSSGLETFTKALAVGQGIPVQEQRTADILAQRFGVMSPEEAAKQGMIESAAPYREEASRQAEVEYEKARRESPYLEFAGKYLPLMFGLAKPAATGVVQTGQAIKSGAQAAPAALGKALEYGAAKTIGYGPTQVLKSGLRQLLGKGPAGLTPQEAARQIAERTPTVSKESLKYSGAQLPPGIAPEEAARRTAELTPLVSREALPYTGLSQVEAQQLQRAQLGQTSELAQKQASELTAALRTKAGLAPGTAELQLADIEAAGLLDDPRIRDIIGQQTGFPKTITETRKVPYFDKEVGVSPEYQRQRPPYKTPESVEQSLTEPTTQQSFKMQGLEPAPLPPEMARNLPVEPGTKTYRVTQEPMSSEPITEEFLSQQQRLPLAERVTTTRVKEPKTPTKVVLGQTQLNNLRTHVNELANYAERNGIPFAKQKAIGELANKLRAAQDAILPESIPLREGITSTLKTKKQLAPKVKATKEGRAVELDVSEAKAIDAAIPGSKLEQFFSGLKEASSYDKGLKAQRGKETALGRKVRSPQEEQAIKEAKDYESALKSHNEQSVDIGRKVEPQAAPKPARKWPSLGLSMEVVEPYDPRHPFITEDITKAIDLDRTLAPTTGEFLRDISPEDYATRMGWKPTPVEQIPQIKNLEELLKGIKR